MTHPRHCCKIGCDHLAEFVIVTTRQDGGIAGPDIYSDETDACCAHVGDLLGHQPDMHLPEEVEWRIVPIPAGGQS